MSVAKDAVMTGGNGGGGAYQYLSGGGGTQVTAAAGSSITVGASATLLVATLDIGGNNTSPGTPACTWNGTAMNLACSIYNSTSIGAGAAIFTLVKPTSGNKALVGTWSGTNFANMSAISFTGTDTVTGYQAADNVTGNATVGNQSIAINTDANGATVCTINCVSSGLSVNSQTQIFSGSPTNDNAAASYAIGGSGSNTHTFDVTAGTEEAWAGIHIIAPAAAVISGLLASTNEGGF